MNSPELPPLTPEQTAGLEYVLHAAASLMVRKYWARGCLHCVHFDEAAEACRFYTPTMRPPVRVIVNGCAAFKTNELEAF